MTGHLHFEIKVCVSVDGKGKNRKEIPKSFVPSQGRAGQGEQTWPLRANSWAQAEGLILWPLSLGD